MLAYSYIDGNYVTINESQVVIDSGCTLVIARDIETYECGHSIHKDTNDHVEHWYLYGDGTIKDECSDYVSYAYHSHITLKRSCVCPKERVYIRNVAYIDTPCYGCMNAKGHENDVINHGLQAFRMAEESATCTDSLVRVRDILCNHSWEICCTNRNEYCGPIGITGTGDVIAYFPTDVYSMPINKRTILDLGLTKLRNCLILGDKDISHDEYWVCNLEIQYIWVKEWYWNTLTQEEREMVLFMTATYSKINTIKIV